MVQAVVVDGAEEACHGAALDPGAQCVEAYCQTLAHTSRPAPNADRDRAVVVEAGPGQDLFDPLAGNAGQALFGRQVVDLIGARLIHEPAHDCTSHDRVAAAGAISQVQDHRLTRREAGHGAVEGGHRVEAAKGVVEQEDDGLAVA